MDIYQQVIYKSRYARWLDKENRRETWEETVDRYISYFQNVHKDIKGIPWGELRDSIYNMEVMPSMRALMTAGKALDRDHIAGYNCTGLAIDSPRAFDEAMYLLMCGAGLGFSVENHFISKLPEIAEEFHDTDTTIVVSDSRSGWASSFRELLSLLWSGRIPKWDTSKVRAAGERLKTFGGRASGPGPLEDLFRFTTHMFQNAAGRKLTSLECHDLMCKVSEIVVMGGVRRSAAVSHSDLSDDAMRAAKKGQWWVDNEQRQLANNSAIYDGTPDIGLFMQEWGSLYMSKSGERGIINRKALKAQAQKTGRRDVNHDFLLNPCAEAILRPSGGLCNLTEVIVRDDDTQETLKRKIRLATILGTLQASLTDFKYLRRIWKKNAEEEALLGVSLTGIMDSKLLANHTKDNLPAVLNDFKELAVAVNKEYAAKIGTNQACQVTLVKPSGTVSQLVNCSSGIHPRYARHYIRRIRMDKKDPVSPVLIDSGVPYEDDHLNSSVYVFAFPIESPEDSIFIADMSAIDQLEHWLIYRNHWCEGNPSVTIYIEEHEWLEVGAWVYRNFDDIGGLAFLPYSDHIYKQAPYEEITEETYTQLVEAMPAEIDWAMLTKYEIEDQTTSSHELACSGGSCEL